MTGPPRVDIDLAAFDADPYPTLARLRREAPVAFVPQLGAVLLTRRDDIFHWEKQVDVFSSDQPGGLMNRLMGQNMMRKDGPQHMAERKVFLQAVSPAAVRAVWVERFRDAAAAILDTLAPRGAGDLMQDFAMPLAGACLVEMTGLLDTEPHEIDAWSQALIAGISNYAGDPQVEARCRAAAAAIDAAIDRRLSEVGRPSDPSLLAIMLAGGMPIENVRHNIKLTISGGQNEPRKAIAGCIWALLAHPEALAAVRAGRLTYAQVFDEYVRWMAPIGMSPRRIARAVTIHGVTLEPDTRAFLMFASANRDERHFPDADRFMPGRDTTAAIAFGAGPHFCAGTWAARAMIAEVALPAAFDRLAGLAVAPGADITFSGWAFRGLRSLPSTWSATSAAAEPSRNGTIPADGRPPGGPARGLH